MQTSRGSPMCSRGSRTSTSGTVLAGRTWLQQATPVTFGLKAAGALSAVERHRARLRELRPRVLALQFGGASGTLAALGADGLKVAAALADQLKLALPDVPWHAHRDRVAEVATALGLLVGTLGKIARDVSLLMQTEVGEAFEPAAAGKGGSSTMPHKRNPVGCATILAAAIRVPGLVSVMLTAMVQEHERGLGDWHAEWDTLPEICCLAAGALAQLAQVLEGLELDPARMAANLEATRGLVLAEAVTMALGGKIGRLPAHHLVEGACRRAAAEDRHLRDVLEADAEVRQASVGRRPAAAARSGELRRSRRDHGGARPGGAREVTRTKERGRCRSRKSTGRGSTTGSMDRSTRRCWCCATRSAPITRCGTRRSRRSRRKLRVLRYDRRGHGVSAVTPGPYTIEQLGRDALGLLDALGLDRVRYCGLSLGGMTGMWLGTNAADRIERLVLCNTAAHIGAPEPWNARIEAVRKGGMAAIEAAVMARWFTPRFLARPTPMLGRMREVFLAAVARGLRRVLRGGPRHGPARVDRAHRRADARDRRHPRCVDDAGGGAVHGREDQGRPLRRAGRRAHFQRRGRGAVHRDRARLRRRLGATPMDDKERYAAGMQVRRAVLGDAHVDRTLKNKNPFNEEYQDLITRYAWGEIWTRPGLPRHTRSLLTLGWMVALNRDAEFRMHVRAAFNNGVTRDEIKEMLLQCAIYCGVPAANAAYHSAQEVFAEMDAAKR